MPGHATPSPLPRVSVEPLQRPVLTGELRQSLALLELNALELGRSLAQRALENPFLEVDVREPAEVAGSVADQAAREAWGPRAAGTQGDAWIPREAAAAPWPGSIYEYIERQVALEPLSPDLAADVRELIGWMDERGFIRETPAEIAAATGLAEGRVEKALRTIRGLEPAGIGARDARESLLLQLRRRMETGNLPGKAPGDAPGNAPGNAPEHLAARLLEHEFSALAGGRWKGLARRMGISLHELGQALQVLRSLHPSPAAAVLPGSSPPVPFPDLTIRLLPGGELAVVVNTCALLRVEYQRRVAARLLDQVSDPIDRQRIRTWQREAGWVMSAVARREMTLQKVGEALVQLQPDFFLEGRDRLLPMTLDDVAARVGVHKSTISRAVRHKWIEAPHGLLPLARMFSSALPADGGRRVSAAAVKQRIAELIGSEDPLAPWSDQQLQERLAAEGIPLSRRVIAKYRSELGIPARAFRLRASS